MAISNTIKEVERVRNGKWGERDFKGKIYEGEREISQFIAYPMSRQVRIFRERKTVEIDRG